MARPKKPGGPDPRKCVRISQADWDFLGGVALRFGTDSSKLIRFAALRLADELNDNPTGKAADAFVQSIKKERA